MKLGKFLRKTTNGYAAFCPGCQSFHMFDQRWTFDGNSDRPSFTPSLNVDPGGKLQCHSFVREGKWEFLADCWHDLRGQIVPMQELPEDIWGELNG